jgi:nitrous oxide reductase
MREKQKSAMDRRNFLRAAVATPAVAAVAVASPMAATEAEAYEPGREETKARYKADSPGVQAFYRTNGYETLKK